MWVSVGFLVGYVDLCGYSQRNSVGMGIEILFPWQPYCRGNGNLGIPIWDGNYFKPMGIPTCGNLWRCGHLSGFSVKSYLYNIIENIIL